MALVDYKKYQVLINPDSKKIQGLQTGDIVRRQYFDGSKTIYSLMCVLSEGVERTKNNTTQLYEERAYFIGALLEGDALDSSDKRDILDFARITNLFDVDRSGALYLTASDSQAPFMDVIDGIGRNKSLSWPESISFDGQEDSQTQYIVKGTSALNQRYETFSGNNSRVLTVTRTESRGELFEGLQQDFYQFIPANNQVLISYKVRASKPMKDVKASLGYQDGVRVDAEWKEELTTSWEYKFRVVSVENSGRHLRSLKIDMATLEIGEEIQIADFNIILLSSLSNFSDSSVSRVGKLDGVVDPVFGQINGYGAYLQKLYASSSAHVSGTLTAGDENGFGSTFYAGKIHKNHFINSIAPRFTTNVNPEGSESSVENPTGFSNVYKITQLAEMLAQTQSWAVEQNGKRYTFSFWCFAKKPVQIQVSQNNRAVGQIAISSNQTHEWRRVYVSFEIAPLPALSTSVILSITPTFTEGESEDENAFYFTAPQLEAGRTATQYQATDETLNPTEEYGAWFSRGGIGGTMQNPLLQLNIPDEDGGEGGIGTRSKSFLLRQDGSGFLANKNISWGPDGKVVFGNNVTINWDNLSSEAQRKMEYRSCRIHGEDTFTMIGAEEGAPITPSSITLAVEEEGFSSSSSQRKWMHLIDGEWREIPNATQKTLVITPDSEMWNMEVVSEGITVGGDSVLMVKYEVTLDGKTYSDTKTIRKQYVQGFYVEIVTSNGSSCKNGTCKATLTANLYFQGVLVDPEYAKTKFEYLWSRHRADDYSELEFNGKITGPNTIELNHEMNSGEIYICEVVTPDAFDYTLPITF